MLGFSGMPYKQWDKLEADGVSLPSEIAGADTKSLQRMMQSAHDCLTLNEEHMSSEEIIIALAKQDPRVQIIPYSSSEDG